MFIFSLQMFRHCIRPPQVSSIPKDQDIEVDPVFEEPEVLIQLQLNQLQQLKKSVTGELKLSPSATNGEIVEKIKDLVMKCEHFARLSEIVGLNGLDSNREQKENGMVEIKSTSFDQQLEELRKQQQDLNKLVCTQDASAKQQINLQPEGVQNKGIKECVDQLFQKIADLQISIGSSTTNLGDIKSKIQLIGGSLKEVIPKNQSADNLFSVANTVSKYVKGIATSVGCQPWEIGGVLEQDCVRIQEDIGVKCLLHHGFCELLWREKVYKSIIGIKSGSVETGLKEVKSLLGGDEGHSILERIQKIRIVNDKATESIGSVFSVVSIGTRQTQDLSQNNNLFDIVQKMMDVIKRCIEKESQFRALVGYGLADRLDDLKTQNSELNQLVSKQDTSVKQQINLDQLVTAQNQSIRECLTQLFATMKDVQIQLGSTSSNVRDIKQTIQRIEESLKLVIPSILTTNSNLTYVASSTAEYIQNIANTVGCEPKEINEILLQDCKSIEEVIEVKATLHDGLEKLLTSFRGYLGMEKVYKTIIGIKSGSVETGLKEVKSLLGGDEHQSILEKILQIQNIIGCDNDQTIMKSLQLAEKLIGGDASYTILEKLNQIVSLEDEQQDNINTFINALMEKKNKIRCKENIGEPKFENRAKIGSINKFMESIIVETDKEPKSEAEQKVKQIAKTMFNKSFDQIVHEKVLEMDKELKNEAEQKVKQIANTMFRGCELKVEENKQSNCKQIISLLNQLLLEVQKRIKCKVEKEKAKLEAKLGEEEGECDDE